MKKLTIIFAVLAFITFEGNAQTTNDGRGGFGIRGGVNFFNWSGSDASNNDYTNRVGYHAGLYSLIFLGESLAIEPGVYYSVKGTTNDNIANTRAVLNYVDVPLLFRVYFGEGFNFFGGAQASYLLNSNFEGDILGSTFTFNTESVSNFDYAAVIGAGYNLPKGLNVQVSYDLGLNPVFKNSNAEIYNRGFKASLGITF